MYRNLSTLATATLLISAVETMPCIADNNPDVSEVKAIAEEAFIYGFPMNMAYDILYQYSMA